MALPNFPAKDFKIAGNITMHCKGRVLLIGGCNGVLPHVISLFGHEVYGIDNKESVYTARENAYAFGITSRFAIHDMSDSIQLPEGLFDSIVIGTPITNKINLQSTLKETYRLVCNSGCVMFMLKSDKSFDYSLLMKDLQMKIQYSIHQGDNLLLVCEALRHPDSECLASDENTEKINDFFLFPLPLEELDTSKLVTVIIPTYNRYNFIEEALNSVLNQTYPNKEVIVVNDGSTDNTEELIKPYMDRIIYIKKNNGGTASAINAGLRIASGQYYTICDDDDIILPRTLELQMRFIQKNAFVDVLFQDVFNFKHENAQRNIESVRSFPHLSRDELLPWFLHDWLGYGSGLIRSECHQVIGLYREDLRRSQDHEMYIRLARHFNIRFLHMPLILIRMHNTPRKSGGEYFHPDKSDEKGLEYGRLFFPDIYKSLSLDDLIPSLKEKPDNMTLKVRAYCEKGLIAALYLFNEYAISDLKNASALAKTGKISVPVKCFDKVLIIIKRLTTPHLKKNLDGVFSELLSLVRGLSNKNEIKYYLSRRCYWKGMEYFKQRKYSQGIKWLFYSCRFMIAR